MTSVTIDGTTGLVTSQIIHSSFGGSPYETACLHGKMIYNSANFAESCPFEKTRESCMANLKSQAIFQNISATDIPNLMKLADTLNACTPAMKSLIHEVHTSPQSTSEEKRRANELNRICNF